ncbi:hypothetical protein KFE25_011153 [Diacronema lutheri]|uniref:DUF3752 domain-containing protein n=1 Tax=Diacronema lutheri TaxID=2081491 RepID=A0A8J5XCS4_DIALT|nr:hypothetical protein KFE25_011153 [Diacronema lutheri]
MAERDKHKAKSKKKHKSTSKKREHKEARRDKHAEREVRMRPRPARHSSSSSSSDASDDAPGPRAPALPVVPRVADAAAAAETATGVLVELLRARPDGASELESLLELVDGGEAVMTAGLGDAFVRGALEALFLTAGMRVRGGDGAELAFHAVTGETLPLSPLLVRAREAAAADAPAGGRPASADGGGDDGRGGDGGGDGEDAPGPRPRGAAPPPPASPGARSSPTGPAPRILGPARPPPALLAASAALPDTDRLALAAVAHEGGAGDGSPERRADVSDGDSPLVGPALPPGAGGAGGALAPPVRPQWWQRTAADLAAAAAAHAEPEEPVREEWMTALPTGRHGPIFAPDVARTFTRSGVTELGDNSGWMDTPADVARKAAARLAAAMAAATAREGGAGAVLSGLALAPRAAAANDAPRPAPAPAPARLARATAEPPPRAAAPKSLVELHLDARRRLAGGGDGDSGGSGAAKRAKGGGGGADGGKSGGKGGGKSGMPLDWDPSTAPWRPFDRDKDLDARRADPDGVKRALNDHVMGTLSSRFGAKGKVESTFM